MARIVIERECEHGKVDCSWPLHHDYDPLPPKCEGGLSYVVDPDRLPSRSIEAAAKALYNTDAVFRMPWESCSDAQAYRDNAETVIRAFLADLEQGDQE